MPEFIRHVRRPGSHVTFIVNLKIKRANSRDEMCVEVSNDLLSIRQAADYAKVSYETVGRWIRNHGLASKLVTVRGRSKQRRIKESDLIKFLNES